MKKYLVLIIVLSGNFLTKLCAEPTNNLDTVAFWTAVAHSRQIIDNPEFRKHAEANLQRVQTMHRNEGLAHKNASGLGLGNISENREDKAKAFFGGDKKDKHLTPAHKAHARKEEHKTHTRTVEKKHETKHKPKKVEKKTESKKIKK